MTAAKHFPEPFAEIILPNYEPLEIHRSKISLDHAKVGYSYPTIRLPHTLGKLAGLSTRIYQTVHKGALAFLMVVAPTDTSNRAAGGCENDAARAKSSVFTRQIVFLN